MYCDGALDDKLDLTDEDIKEMIKGTEYDKKHDDDPPVSKAVSSLLNATACLTRFSIS